MSTAADIPTPRASRLNALEPAVKRGYLVWPGVGAAIAVPELWAVFGRPRWPTISGTVGHLETLWDGVAVIVVFAIVAIAANAFRLRDVGPGDWVVQADGARLGRSAGGRLTNAPESYREVSAFLYFPFALVVVVAGCILAATVSDDEWVLGYVIYGFIGLLFVLVPSVLAYGRRTPDAPFASLFRTLGDLQSRSHLAAAVILAGLAVLLIHLAFYPWPDVPRQTPTPGSP